MVVTPSFFLKSKAMRLMKHPAKAPAPWKSIMKIANKRLPANYALPSFQSMPKVTAELKCPPLMPPNIVAMTKTVEPTANGTESEVLAQLIAMSRNIVPMNSETKTKNLLPLPPGTSIFFLDLFISFINY
jgi:hypothetical protein